MGRFVHGMAGPLGVDLLNSMDDQLQILSNGGTVSVPAPGIPSGVTPSAATSNTMLISWGAATNAAGYNVYRNGAKITPTPISAFSVTDTGLAASTQYTWTVKAVNGAGVEGAVSATATATTSAPPLAVPVAPTGVVTSNPTPNAVTISWTAVSGVSGYNIYRGTIRDNPDLVTGTTYTDTGLSAATAYSWTVKAVNSAGEGAASSAATGTTSAAPAAVPGAPTSITATNPTQSSMVIGWAAPATGSPTSYNVFRNGGKVNASPVVGLSYTDTGLQPFTQYSWTVTASNAVGEGVASSAAVATTSANTIAGLTPMPTKVLACYFEAYNGQHNITAVPLDFNVIFLFNAQPNGGVRGNRANQGNGSFFMENLNESQISQASVQAVRSRGQKVILTVGGSSAGYNFDLRAKSQNFVNSFIAMSTALGGVDGCDFNNFEADIQPLVSEMVWIAQQLKAQYGANFAITCPPNPDGTVLYGKPYDRTLTKALSDNNVLTWAGPQHYDASHFKNPGSVKGFVDQWVVHLGDQQKVMVGLSANYDFANGLTYAECVREMNSILAAYPNIRGTYCWNAQTNINSGNQWGAGMKALLGASTGTSTPSTPTATVQAVTDAFAYSGGQNGAHLDGASQYVRRIYTDNASTPTTGGDPIQRMVDRSANTNDIYITVNANSGSYTLDNAAFPAAYFYNPASSTTGGGSGDTNSSGFFACMAVRLVIYNSTLWSDASGANTGRWLRYSGDTGGITFSVGTGSARTAVTVSGLTPQFQSPGQKPVVVKAWQDASNIYLQVNGGSVVSAACAACSPGSANYTLPGLFGGTTEGGIHVYAHVHTLNALTGALRDGVSSYIASKLPPT